MWLRFGAFLPAISIQFVQALVVGPTHPIFRAAPLVFGLLLLAIAAFGIWTASTSVKVRPAAFPAGAHHGAYLERPAPSRPMAGIVPAASLARCPASHADGEPLPAPPTVARTWRFRCFERTAELSGSASGDKGAAGPISLRASGAEARCHGVAPLRTEPALRSRSHNPDLPHCRFA